MNDTRKSIDYKEECKLFMAEYGLEPTEVIADGKIHRYSVDEKRTKLDEWYVAKEGYSQFNNPYFVCSFGSWSDQLNANYTYKSYDTDSLSEQEVIELKEIANKQRLQAEKETKEGYGKAAIRAQEIWKTSSSNPLLEGHLEYINEKGIKLFDGIKFGEYSKNRYPSIIIPLKNEKDELRSLQFIFFVKGAEKPHDKRFLFQGETKGNYHIIGKITSEENEIFICEGYATGATLYEAIKKPVVIAFSASNIYLVAEKLRHAFPKKTIIIAADVDEAGMKKANDAALKSRCFVAIPHFPQDHKRDEGNDYNDLYKIAGIDEVKRQLIEACYTSDAGVHLAKKYFAPGDDPCKSFKLSNLPAVLREYISAIQKTTSAHPLMITSSVFTMVSAYLGTKVYIPEGEYFQNLYPNLWMLCIAKSGQFKTTALNKGASIAYKRQTRIFSAIKEMRDNMQDDETSIEKAVILKSLENVVLPTKMTAEGFLEYVAQGHEGAIYTSEFGAWLQNFDKSHNNDFKAIMTEIYDVPPCYRYRTRTQGDSILERPFVSICGVSTISWVHSNIKPNDVPSGFFARFLLITPPFEDKIPPALPSRKVDDYEEREAHFNASLDNILRCVGDERTFILSQEAKNAFYKYHLLIYCVPRICSDTIGEFLQPYLKRWSPTLLKIAMIIQLFLDPETDEISAEAIHQAFHVLNTAIKSTIGLFEGELGESSYQRKCRLLFDWLKRRMNKEQKPVKRQAILASKQLNGGVKQYDTILQDLIEQGKLMCKEVSTKKNEFEYSIIEEIDDN